MKITKKQLKMLIKERVELILKQAKNINTQINVKNNIQVDIKDISSKIILTPDKHKPKEDFDMNINIKIDMDSINNIINAQMDIFRQELTNIICDEMIQVISDYIKKEGDKLTKEENYDYDDFYLDKINKGKLDKLIFKNLKNNQGGEVQFEYNTRINYEK